eukprot:CAMPEP_0194768960 /NCGR_PEP_ID=MMETSP0323_2-20130528/41383_1 /TAXON_ID=2866 ORGANISM="Crypthecodinium cohnii, Strain Seligo" /NCGR_SAMPLE_ID=MMETSP0323_2 /ASSEMBLY_ACC=CAM_ASM_000346 /LENGTH=108 /DNA_ID=CAMNT_0039701651 /DNA_START=17 /DNA_END=340 /DNA_ORIENTATION=-
MEIGINRSAVKCSVAHAGEAIIDSKQHRSDWTCSPMPQRHDRSQRDQVQGQQRDAFENLQALFLHHDAGHETLGQEQDDDLNIEVPSEPVQAHPYEQQCQPQGVVDQH